MKKFIFLLLILLSFSYGCATKNIILPDREELSVPITKLSEKYPSLGKADENKIVNVNISCNQFDKLTNKYDKYDEKEWHFFDYIPLWFFPLSGFSGASIMFLLLLPSAVVFPLSHDYIWQENEYKITSRVGYSLPCGYRKTISSITYEKIK